MIRLLSFGKLVSRAVVGMSEFNKHNFAYGVAMLDDHAAVEKE